MHSELANIRMESEHTEDDGTEEWEEFRLYGTFELQKYPQDHPSLHPREGNITNTSGFPLML